jgi:1,5-anhydro-D-fructose reductase (1,5-anhydro-D-mannitol-forming)
MAEITLGLVGASNMAMTWMLPALQATGVAVRGLYDDEPHRFRYWADSGVDGQTTNLDQLLSSDIDAIYISSRNDQHVAQTVAAAAAGKHVLVEKPMALDLTEAQTMIDAARRHGVVLAVNHHLVASPLHVTARRLVRQGWIGNLVAARVSHAGLLPAHLRGWRMTRAPGAGVIMDLTVHDASVLNPLFGCSPVEVTAFAAAQATWNESGAIDSAMTLLRYPWGGGPDRLASTHDSFTVAGPETAMEILGDEGAIVIGDAMTQVTNGSVHLYASGRVEPIDVDTSRSLYITVLEAFVAAIRGDGRPTVSGEEGRAALEVAFAADRAATTGRTVGLHELH